MDVTLADIEECGLKAFITGIENKLCDQALALTGGSIREACKLLKIKRTTLSEKLRKRGFFNEAGELLRLEKNDTGNYKLHVPGGPNVILTEGDLRDLKSLLFNTN